MDALLTALAGIATSLIMGGVRAGTTLLDKLPPIGRSIVALALAEGVSLLNKVSGLSLPADPSTWTATLTNGLAIWLLAMGAHALKKAVTRS